MTTAAAPPQTTPGPVAPESSGAKGVALAALPYVVAVIAAFVVVGILISALGHDPFQAFRAVLTNSFRSPAGMVQTLHKWVPVTLLALAFAIPFVAGRFNIGGEGQLILGATGAVAVGITLSELPMFILLPLSMVAGVLAGALWAGIAAVLMDRFKINEILSTVLLNFVSFEVLDYFASHIWPNTMAGFPATVDVGAGAFLPTIGRPPMHLGVLLVVAVSAFVAFWGRRSVQGFELRSVGLNERAARVHGVRASRVAVLSLVAGGALGGLAGAIEVAGVHHRMLEDMQSNFLLLGIIVGLIARGSFVAIPFVAFGISVLEVGAGSMQRVSGTPAEMILILEGLILIFLLMSDVIMGRLRARARKAKGA